MPNCSNKGVARSGVKEYLLYSCALVSKAVTSVNYVATYLYIRVFEFIVARRMRAVGALSWRIHAGLLQQRGSKIRSIGILAVFLCFGEQSGY
jgi:hypothetical protein